jgi:D-ribulokinase
MSKYLVGIDVGTGSARAGIFDRDGRLLASAKQPIALYRDDGILAEQSSSDIWRAVCHCVREAVASAGIDGGDVAGIGFDATCSLVVLGENGQPLTISRTGDPDRNIVVWMDHRATEQARRINATGEHVLSYVGGAISPEMQAPKLLWLAENMPDTFAATANFLDLTDFLTWKSTGNLSRSVCTVTCKWTYLAHEQRWDEAFFRRIGLGVLADEGFRRIGTEIVAAGTALGAGLTAEAAADMGLPAGIAVGAGLIDAHAGGIGTVGARGGGGSLETRMAYVFGTSACTMSTTSEPAFVPGIWGPYYSAMVPGLWLNEGGQSAAGAAIDHLIKFHPAASEAAEQARLAGLGLGPWLGLEAERLGGASAISDIVGSIAVLPEFLGNRAPFADPNAKGMIAGLGMETSLESLIGLYLAGMCGLAYGARQIVDQQRQKGVAVDTILVSGGAAESALSRQLIADATGWPVARSASPEPVLLGSAMLGAVASGVHPDLRQAMDAMSSISDIHEPSAATRHWHDARYEVFQAMQALDRKLRGHS